MQTPTGNSAAIDGKRPVHANRSKCDGWLGKAKKERKKESLTSKISPGFGSFKF